MLRIRTVLVVALLMVTTALAAPEPNSLAPGRIVVMVSVDGLAGYYIDDPKAEMPNIRALAAEGARAASMKAVVPTVTWPNHASLVTGVQPAKHGVIGNNYFDRATSKPVQLISDPVLDKDQIIHVPTIYDLAKAQGFITAAVRWPGTRNAKTIDFCVPELIVVDELKKLTTPAVIELCEKDG